MLYLPLRAAPFQAFGHTWTSQHQPYARELGGEYAYQAWLRGLTLERDDTSDIIGPKQR
jgi:hypothetical protein